MLNKQKKFLKTIILSALIGFGMMSSANAYKSISEANTLQMVPHRAVYDLKLEKSVTKANITDANGRMVFEVLGSKCDGYLVSMRFFLSVMDGKGHVNTTDVRSSSWEDGNAKRFRFNTSRYDNQKLSKTTIGDASRNDGKGIEVKIKSPKKTNAKFDGKTYFPTEHTKLVIDAALKGQSFVSAPIYDGSENGNTLYDTTAFIGKEHKRDEFVGKSKIKNIEHMKNVKSWPVSIGFFDKNKSKNQDHLPDFEIAMRLYQNGVSRELLIDYGDFSLNGTMKQIEFLPVSACK